MSGTQNLKPPASPLNAGHRVMPRTCEIVAFLLRFALKKPGRH
jgi:hypothetical protein